MNNCKNNNFICLRMNCLNCNIPILKYIYNNQQINNKCNHCKKNKLQIQVVKPKKKQDGLHYCYCNNLLNINKYNFFEQKIKKYYYCNKCHIIYKYIKSNLRVFGYFKCHTCSNQWTSAYVYKKNYNSNKIKWKLKCIKCGNLNFPYKINELKKSNNKKNESNKNHKKELCEGCIKNGSCYLLKNIKKYK